MDLEISDMVLFMLKRDKTRFIERRAITKLFTWRPNELIENSESDNLQKMQNYYNSKQN